GLVFAGRPADRGHPYGHGKIEYFSAVFEGGLIAFAAVLILWQAFQTLRAGHVVHDVDLGIALTVAAGGVNAALGWYLVRTGGRARGGGGRQARAVGLLDKPRRLRRADARPPHRYRLARPARRRGGGREPRRHGRAARPPGGRWSARRGGQRPPRSARASLRS